VDGGQWYFLTSSRIFLRYSRCQLGTGSDRATEVPQGFTVGFRVASPIPSARRVFSSKFIGQTSLIKRITAFASQVRYRTEASQLKLCNRAASHKFSQVAAENHLFAEESRNATGS